MLEVLIFPASHAHQHAQHAILLMVLINAFPVLVLYFWMVIIAIRLALLVNLNRFQIELVKRAILLVQHV